MCLNIRCKLFYSVIHAFAVIKRTHYLASCQFTLVLASRGYIVWVPIVGLLVHFELIFMCDVREESTLTLLHVDIWFHFFFFCKECLFPPDDPDILVKISWLQMSGFASASLILLSSAWQKWAVFITITSETRKCHLLLKSTALALWGHLNFSLQGYWIFNGSCTESVGNLERCH